MGPETQEEDSDTRRVSLPVRGVVKGVEVIEGKEAGPDYGAYAIVITTDQGKWTIAGCHDMGPELLEQKEGQKP